MWNEVLILWDFLGKWGITKEDREQSDTFGGQFWFSHILAIKLKSLMQDLKIWNKEKSLKMSLLRKLLP